MDTSVKEDDEPIYGLSIECEALFEKGACLDSLAEAGAILLWEEHKERFTTWASYLGVFAKRSLCLDRRLEHHPNLWDLVLRLLDILHRNLTRVINGKDSLIRQSRLVSEEEGTSEGPRDEPLLDSLRAIESALERLNRLGVAIRESSVSSRSTRAKRLVGTPDYASFKELAHLAIRALYPCTSVSLQDQLSASMADRYADIVSRRTHQRMLGRPRAQPQPVSQAIGEEALAGGPGDSQGSPVPLAQARTDKSAPSPTPRSVLASERPSSTNTRLVELQMRTSRRSGSGRSRASSVQINQVPYPRPLHARAGENFLTCEWCFESRPKRFFEGPEWRRHVDRDLKPYVCVAEDCTDPLPSFTNFRDWHGHMLAKHGRNWHREVHLPLSWTCPFCPSVSAAFHDPEEAAMHISDFHELGLSDTVARTIAGQSRIQMRRKHGECPICCLSISTESPQNSADGRKQRQEPQPARTGSDSTQTAQGNRAIGGTSDSGVSERHTLVKEARIPVETVARHIASHLQALTFLTTRIMSIHNHNAADNVSQGSSADTSVQTSCDSRRSVEDDSREAWGFDDDEEKGDIEPPSDADERAPYVVWDHIFLSKDLPTEEKDHILEHLQQKQQDLSSRDIPLPSNPSISPKPESGLLLKTDLLGPMFRAHVSFDTTSQDINEVSGITLSARHDSFRAHRHSRIVLVGVDENKPFGAALEWLLTDMVNDYDTVVCVRVVDTVARFHKNVNMKHAHRLLGEIVKKNRLDKVICIILEYQFGRLYPIFDTMVTVHQPSIIVIGTEETAIQLVQAAREIPLVVVLPLDVRLKKKDERAGDPEWGSYKQMLSTTKGVHESDVIDDEKLLSSATQLSLANEASEVAKAICEGDWLDAATNSFDGETAHRQPHTLASWGLNRMPGNANWNAAASIEGNSDVDSLDDYDDDNVKYVQEALLAGALKQMMKERLHKMEVGEAAALKRGKPEDLIDI